MVNSTSIFSENEKSYIIDQRKKSFFIFFIYFLIFLITYYVFVQPGTIKQKYYLSYIPSSFFGSFKEWKCGNTIKSMASQLLTKYGNQSKQLLLESYRQLTSQNLKNDTLDVIHFIYSNIFASLMSDNICLDYPKSYRDKVIPQIKDLKIIKPQIFKSNQVEVFYFEHGLRFADKRIIDYIKERDILDIGACEGDSAYVFMNRTKKRIFSYEPSQNNVQVIKKIAESLHYDPKKFILVPKGISNKNEKRHLSDCIGGSCSSNDVQNASQVDFVTIDSEVERNNMTLGLIKVDTEGFGVQVFLGGIKSFQKDRPVFSLSIYHNFDEFYEIPKHILELPNYEIEFQIQHNYNPQGDQKLNTYGYAEIYELIVFAYPKEIFEKN